MLHAIKNNTYEKGDELVSVEENKEKAEIHKEKINTEVLPESHRLAQEAVERYRFTKNTVGEQINSAVKKIGIAALELQKLKELTNHDLQSVTTRIRMTEAMTQKVETIRQDIHNLFTASENEGAIGAQNSIDQAPASIQESAVGLQTTSNHLDQTIHSGDRALEALQTVLSRIQRIVEKLETAEEPIIAASQDLEKTSTALEGTVDGLEEYITTG